MSSMQPNPQEPREQALAALDALEVTATGLVEYRAGNRVVVLGDERAVQAASSIAPPLQPIVVSSAPGRAEPLLLRTDGRDLQLSGYLGAFQLQIGEVEEGLAVAADLVLDLSVPPLLSMAVKPPGYLATGDDPQALDQALTELGQLTGTFDKPDYVHYDPDRCAHARNGVTACTRCIDACPTEAIRSLAERIEVDPYLCQGGGVCASVCPSGAIAYAYPRAGDLTTRIRTLLKHYYAADGKDAVLLVHAGERPAAERLAGAPGVLPLAVEEVASVGPESWLSALAYGARAVRIELDEEAPAQVRDALQGPLQMVAGILAGLDFPSGAVSMVGSGYAGEEDEPRLPPIELAVHAPMDDKRTNLYLALDHLHAQAARSKPMVMLEAGAPFGTAGVEAVRCTLCMACASVCPGHALQDGQGEPQLRFIEANCIQCGLCTRTCPENAIWITPRLLLDRDARTRPRVLHQEEPFCCVNCGKPFATRSVIDNMLGKLSDHWMFQDERARRRLKMCDECRVVDVVQDEQAMQGDPIPRQ